MGSIERKLRLKDEVRSRILDAAMDIVKKEGWQAVSMRRIADVIEYTAPVIYDHFDNKDAILQVLTRMGYSMLVDILKKTAVNYERPVQRLEEMWLTYWEFAFEERGLYQLMFGIEMSCSGNLRDLAEVQELARLFKVAIRALYAGRVDEKELSMQYYTCWSIVHGLIAINVVNKGSINMVNRHIIVNAIHAIYRNIS